jgi:hypothetical protein
MYADYLHVGRLAELVGHGLSGDETGRPLKSGVNGPERTEQDAYHGGPA